MQLNAQTYFRPHFYDIRRLRQFDSIEKRTEQNERDVFITDANFPLIKSQVNLYLSQIATQNLAHLFKFSPNLLEHRNTVSLRGLKRAKLFYHKPL